MTKAAIETQVLNELRHLPLEQAKETLDFVMFLRSRVSQQNPQPTRPIGLMQGKASCHIPDEFAVSDEELLGL
jgi:hypothetical protein